MGEFVPLTSVLEQWFERDRSELPCDLDEAWRGSRQLGGVKLLLGVWDGLSPAQRRIMAAQFDYSRDPANRVTAKKAFEIEVEIQKWEAAATPTACDIGEQQRALETLRRQFAEIDAGGSIFATDARAKEEAASMPVAVAAKRKGPRRNDYTIKDGLLVEEMHALIETRAARNATDAALAVVSRAEGRGNCASKVKRLTSRYSEKHGNPQN